MSYRAARYLRRFPIRHTGGEVPAEFDVITDRLGEGAKCPECGSEEVSERHAEPTFAYPETDFKQCDECSHQWDHQ